MSALFLLLEKASCFANEGQKILLNISKESSALSHPDTCTSLQVLDRCYLGALSQNYLTQVLHCTCLLPSDERASPKV